jgi:hypothetical protein
MSNVQYPREEKEDPDKRVSEVPYSLTPGAGRFSNLPGAGGETVVL